MMRCGFACAQLLYFTQHTGTGLNYFSGDTVKNGRKCSNQLFSDAHTRTQGVRKRNSVVEWQHSKQLNRMEKWFCQDLIYDRHTFYMCGPWARSKLNWPDLINWLLLLLLLLSPQLPFLQQRQPHQLTKTINQVFVSNFFLLSNHFNRIVCSYCSLTFSHSLAFSHYALQFYKTNLRKYMSN